MEVETRIRNDNSGVVGHVHSINSVTEARRLNGLLESNSEDSGANPGLDLPRIADPLCIPDELTKSTTQTKLIFLLSRNISQTMSEKRKMG